MIDNKLSKEYRDRLAQVRKTFDAIVDTSILSEEDIAGVELQAEEEVLQEAKAKAKEKLLKHLKKQQSRKQGVEEALETVTVDLPPYCSRILLDNVSYLQGLTYELPVSQVMVIREIIQRTWGHQSEIDGKSEDYYRRTRGAVVSPRGEINTRSSLLRA